MIPESLVKLPRFLPHREVAIGPDLELRTALKEEGVSALCANPFVLHGAGHGARTRDFYLGKVALYH
jgi:hypothetical protein